LCIAIFWGEEWQPNFLVTSNRLLQPGLRAHWPAQPPCYTIYP
jgi:hypothetical protein